MDLDQPPLSAILDFLREQALPVLLIVAVALIAMRLAGTFIHGIVVTLIDRGEAENTTQELSAVEVKKRMDTLDGFIAAVVRFVIFVLAGLAILGRLGFDIGPAIAGLGVVGIAVGFGAQTLVRDYLNGALILIENQFSKGDVVTVAGVTGVVEDFDLRRTTLRDLDGVVHTVPNGEIKVASNLTRTWSRINQDVTVAYGTDIDLASSVVEAVGKEMAADPTWKRRILEPPRVERVEALGEFGITLKILGSVRAADRWAAGGELRKRLLAAFQANDIEIPRPQRVILSRDPIRGYGPAIDDALEEGPSEDDLAADTD